MHPLKPFAYVEHSEGLSSRCSADQSKARQRLPAPAKPGQRGSNYLAFLAIRLHLETTKRAS